MKANKKVNGILTELAIVQLTIEQSNVPSREDEHCEMIGRKHMLIDELMDECAKLEFDA